MTVAFQGEPNTTYIVLAKTNLLGSWSAVATNLTGPDGAWSYTQSTAGWPQQYFRAEVAP